RLRASSRERTSRPRSPIRAMVVPGSIRRGGTATDDLHTIELHALRAIDHDHALALARRVGRAPGAPLGGALVGAVRGRIRECGNGTTLLILSAMGLEKDGARRPPSTPATAIGERRPRRRAAPRPPGGWGGLRDAAPGRASGPASPSLPLSACRAYERPCC